MPQSATPSATRTDWITDRATGAIHRLIEIDDDCIGTACGARLALDQVAIHDVLLDYDGFDCEECRS